MQISLKAARANADMTQAQMAEKMGVAVSTISQWEKGIQEMSARQFFKFCNITGVSRDSIYLP